MQQASRIRRTARAEMLGWCAVPLLLGSIPALAQTTGHGTATQTTAPRATAPRSTAPVPLHRAPAANNSVHNHTGSRAPAAYDDSAAPRPTWELPRTITPQWEIPSYNPVQPNPVQGNPRPHSRGYGYGFGYAGIPGYYIDPLALANQDNPDQQPNNAAPTPSGNEPSPQQGFAEDPNAPPPARAPYRGQNVVAAQPNNAGYGNAGPVTDGLDHPEVTLIFNDGRPPMKIHNYAVTASSIFVAEGGHQQQIPLSALDLNATVERNHAAGVDFSVPGGTR